MRLLFLILYSSSLQATVDHQQWPNLTVQGIVLEEKPIGVFLETQARRSDDQDEFYEKFVRPALYYSSQNRGSFFLGTMKRFDSENNEVETRNWLQWLYPVSTSTSFRVRFERRDLRDQSQLSERLRLSGRFNGQDLLVGLLRPFVGLEIFHNFNQVGQNIKPGFAQSRFVLGLSKKLSEHLQFEGSYLNQHIHQPRRSDQTNHVLNLVLNVTF